MGQCSPIHSSGSTWTMVTGRRLLGLHHPRTFCSAPVFGMKLKYSSPFLVCFCHFIFLGLEADGDTVRSFPLPQQSNSLAPSLLERCFVLLLACFGAVVLMQSLQEECDAVLRCPATLRSGEGSGSGLCWDAASLLSPCCAHLMFSGRQQQTSVF